MQSLAVWCHEIHGLSLLPLMHVEKKLTIILLLFFYSRTHSIKLVWMNSSLSIAHHSAWLRAACFTIRKKTNSVQVPLQSRVCGFNYTIDRLWTPDRPVVSSSREKRQQCGLRKISTHKEKNHKANSVVSIYMIESQRVDTILCKLE
jgi:hypothetical protein